MVQRELASLIALITHVHVERSFMMRQHPFIGTLHYAVTLGTLVILNTCITIPWIDTVLRPLYKIKCEPSCFWI